MADDEADPVGVGVGGEEDVPFGFHEKVGAELEGATQLGIGGVGGGEGAIGGGLLLYWGGRGEAPPFERLGHEGDAGAVERGVDDMELGAKVLVGILVELEFGDGF